MDDLRDAVERYRAAVAALEQAIAWAEFQQMCEILAAIVPGFICPFDGVPGIPTMEQMTPYVDQWEAEHIK